MALSVISRRRRLGMIAMLLLVAATGMAPSTHSKAIPIKSSAALPRTCDEAVSYLLATTAPEDIAFLKTVPRMDLVAFHMGWGTHIRNSLGLWKRRSPLLASCARRVGKGSLHPDEASSLLIDGVWAGIHEGVTDFDTVAPERYFEEVGRSIERAKAGRGTDDLASLPEWVYRPRRIGGGEDDTARSRRLLERADSLAQDEDLLAVLALRYGCFRDPGSRAREARLEALLQVRDRYVELPSYDPEGMSASRSFFPPWPDSARGAGDSTPYHWRRIPVGDFAALSIGVMYGKRFRDAGEYGRWMELRRVNEFVRWAWIDTVVVDSLRKLSSSRRRFLEIAVLTDRFFHRVEDGSEIELRPYPGGATEAFVDVMGVVDSVEPPRKNASTTVLDLSEGNSSRASRLGLPALSKLAHSLERDELLAILDTASIAWYDSACKTDDLLDYQVLCAFLLASESERLVRDPDTARVFDLCLAWWKRKGCLSWALKDRLAAMLFQIDAPRARTLFAQRFASVPTEGAFERNAILAAMIRCDFQASKSLIERWYWIAQATRFRHHPSEARVILDELAATSDQTRALRRRIMRDRRYVAPGD